MPRVGACNEYTQRMFSGEIRNILMRISFIIWSYTLVALVKGVGVMSPQKQSYVQCTVIPQ